jgi:hypothetical protein
MPTDQTHGTPLSTLKVPPLVPSLPLPSRFCITNTPRADNDRPINVALLASRPLRTSSSPCRLHERVRASLLPAPSVESYDARTHVHLDNEEELSYRLVRQVGQGTFSLVWLAHVAKGQSESALVAVKMSARTGEQNDGGAARRVVPREVLHVRGQNKLFARR